ncbi:MAG: SRPBCC domain-containing protein [Candidatus Puniceispirillum sp.]|nr:SRPBCC domain-containing protein [Candidatus Puniceispirillum sp.]
MAKDAPSRVADLVIKRHFPAPLEKMFDLVTQKHHLLTWWGPEDVHIGDNNLDLSLRGAWFSVMINADATTHKVSGEVLAIDAPYSLVFSWGWHDENDVRGHESFVRFDIEDAGVIGASDTSFTLTHMNLPTEESARLHKGGWSSSLVKLEHLSDT